MKILTSHSIKALDAYTIEHEPIASIDLMERAAKSFVDTLKNIFIIEKNSFFIFCGPGNNGGDGLAIARLIEPLAKEVHIYIPESIENCSVDFKQNLDRLKDFSAVRINNYTTISPLNSANSIIIDALFGTGLTRVAGGNYKRVIQFINEQNDPVISVDIPSGMASDEVLRGDTVNADHTISFQIPKLAFYLSENQDKLGALHICNIGLDELYYNELPGHYFSLEADEIKKMVKARKKNTHKHAEGLPYLIAGKKGMMGAALLASKACLRGGAGLLTVHVPESGHALIQQNVPEAVCSIDKNSELISDIPSMDTCTAFGIGPGMGTHLNTVSAFEYFIQKLPKQSQIVVDADALNILAGKKELWNDLKELSFILTPHIGEFHRLFGPTTDSIDQLERLREHAQELGGIIILKGPKTAIAFPDGQIFFNTTGNPGMATAGSGDVLTGLILSFLSQGYSPEASAKLAVFIHGYAGDLAALKYSELSMIASDIIEMIPQTILWIQEKI